MSRRQTTFTPETPLGQAVQALLLEHPDGLRADEIRRLLRREKGLHVNQDNLDELLANHRVFTALPDGRHVLGSASSSTTKQDEEPEASPDPDPWAQPLIGNLPYAGHDYVVFDLETTGTDPEQDRIIQIAALKVAGSKPAAVRNWYVNPGNVDIPYTLQLTLGIVKDPAIQQAISAAPPLSAVLPEFMAFIDDLPLVAHNARFDARFLTTGLENETLPNRVVDCLELALLLLPNLPHHRLQDIAEAVGLPVDSLSAEWSALSLDGALVGHVVSSDTLHNAVTDVYLLHRVYQLLLEKLETPGLVHDVLQTLLPEALSADATFDEVDDACLAPLRDQCNWNQGSDHASPPFAVPPAKEILVRYLEARGYQPRRGQGEMLGLLADALAGDRYAMIEAPTGTGKTLAYLAAAVHAALVEGRPVALSTAYRNLQDQLLADIADLQEHGPVAFRSQLLKGVGNYLCWSQLARYLQEGAPDHKDRTEGNSPLTLAERYILAYVALWLPGSAHGTADELNFWVLETLPAARRVVHQLRAGAACHPAIQDGCAACPMPAAYANAQEANIVVINHALWLADPQRLPPFACIVLDEAHTLEDVATNALAQEVSSQTLGDLLARLYDPRTNRGLLPRVRGSTSDTGTRQRASASIGVVRLVGVLMHDFGTFLAQFIRRCTGRVDPQFGASYRLEAPPWKLHGPQWQRVDDAHRQLFGLHLKRLIDAVTELLQAAAEAQDLAHRAATLRDLADLLDKLAEQRQLAYDLLKVNDQKLVYWLEVGPPTDPESDERDVPPTSWAFKAAPIDVGEALQPFYDRLASASLVSATLALRGTDFGYFINRLGLADRLDSRFVRKLPPALPYAQNVLLGLADYLAYAPLQHTMESFKEELAAELSLLLRFTDGRALGLFTARSRMEAVAGRITPELARHGIPLYVQMPDASRRRLLEEFKARREAVLFGLRSFWEGVDAPGETLSFVLMEKLPFPLLIEPVHRARAEHLVRQGKSEFDDYMLPLMLLQFKQGFGRLLRREDDCGAVVLFDKRIHRKHYKADMLASLPGFRPRDEEAERSRRRFYELLARSFPELFDLDAKQDILAGLPEEILLDLEATLGRYQLPAVIDAAEYDQWRPVLLAAMKELFNHDGFRTIAGIPAQEDVIRHLLAGEDVLGVLPTGSGKSLTFQLPALLRQGVTLVFSPLIALMKDQVAGLNARGIEVVGAIYSGQSASERDDVFERMRRGRARLVYVSPERLRDPQLLITLRQTKVVQAVVDEAHCVYMWGPSFRPDFLYLPRLFDVLGYRPPLAALTATATGTMQEAIVQTLTLRDPARIIAPIDRPELQLIVYNEQSRYSVIRSRSDRFRQLLRILETADRERPPILIYVATTVESDQLARHLRVAGYDARAYHGKMDPADRASVQEMFMDDHINIVVCTKAFGMGIDKPDIRYVIHYNLPGDLESYFQEAGRAGRDGGTAYCILLYHKGDIGTQQYFIEHSTPDEETINHVLRYLAALPGMVLHVDPVRLEEQLGLEDVQLRVALHHLEAQGYLARSADFTLTGEITLQVAPEEATAAWRLDGEADQELLERLFHYSRWPAFRKLKIELLPLADALAAPPSDIDHLLLRLSLRGEAVYRPWQRGFVLEKSAKMAHGGGLSAGALAAEQHCAEMRHKLHEMIAYAEGSDTCRRAAILHYFGQPAADTCHGCDVCDPTREWPWSLVTDRDFATPDAYLDPAFVLLETVKWNLDRAIKYGAPYGTGTLFAILKGDLYAATQFQQDPHLRRWRGQQIRRCPHWGVLSMLPARSRLLSAAADRLVAEGYLCQAEQALTDGGTYQYLDLTDRGIDQLTSGRLLQWEI